MFRVEATGDNLHFQWQKDCITLCDGGRYRGTKTDTLHVIEVDRSDNKARYRCHVKNNIREQFSNEAVLTVCKFIIKCV